MKSIFLCTTLKSYFLCSRTQARKINLALDLLFLKILALPLLLGTHPIPTPINSSTVFPFTQAQNLKGASETSSCIHHPIICQIPLALLQIYYKFWNWQRLANYINSVLLCRWKNWGLEWSDSTTKLSDKARIHISHSSISAVTSPLMQLLV